VWWEKGDMSHFDDIQILISCCFHFSKLGSDSKNVTVAATHSSRSFCGYASSSSPHILNLLLLLLHILKLKYIYI